MKFAYADPPYLGMCKRYDHNHPDGRCWDDVETHRLLIEKLCDEYPDGWAFSLSSVSLRHLLPFCPEDVRIASWCKSWVSFKKGVNPAYAWEPVFFRGGRSWKERGGAESVTVRDWHKGVAHQRGFFGSKPLDFCHWMFGLLGIEPADDFHDLFPGSGAVAEAWRHFQTHRRLAV